MVVQPRLITSKTSLSPVEAQKEAADPKAHAWVSASAGTGKTKVLTDRVLSLLVSGVSPDKILCLTFTKAAAQEMSERVMKTLSTWATLPDHDLQVQLDSLVPEEASSPKTFLRAKKLFGTILDHPQGLTIQTLHSFCQSFLQRFPLEAGVPAGFTAIDEKTQHLLLQQAQQKVLLKSPSPDVKEALIFLSQVFGITSFEEKLTDLILTSRRPDCSLPEALELFLTSKLGQSVSESPSSLVQTLLSDSFFSQILPNSWHHLQEGGIEDQKRAEALKAYLKIPEDQRDDRDFKALAPSFLTQTGALRQRLISKKLAEDSPELLEALRAIGEKCQEVQEALNTLQITRVSHAFIRLAKVILETYTSLKQQQGVLDYDDLIDKTVHTLQNPELAPWILYKMDGGLDHILLDEAQDTNQAQWQVLEALTEEFFSGQGARELMPTVFVVGDVKQSIYSFQGANPALFDAQRALFRQKARASQMPWRDVSLTLSFRSAPEILSLVDGTFAQDAGQGVRTLEETPLPHQAFRTQVAGKVDLWPLETSDDSSSQDTEDLILPSSSQKLAEKIAQTIKTWLTEKRWLASKNRPLCPSDILILVQRRGPFLQALHQALKKADVPATGEDRLTLQDQLCVQDLVALGNFLLMPEDDLSLACVLKSPLVGLTEDDLYTLCQDRPGTLWQALIAATKKRPGFLRAHRFLSDLFSYVDRLTPYELYAKVLLHQNKQRDFLDRLGVQALDPLQEFLNSVQEYEHQKTPSLQGFLHFFTRQTFSLKRDFSASPRAEVRLMTVHGSKGLQAPVVFLPDTVREPRLQDSFLWQEEGPIWNPPRSLPCHRVAQLKAPLLKNLQEEYHRLLYVALTRAEDELYICGFQGHRNPSESCWYRRLHTIMSEKGTSNPEGLLTLSKSSSERLGERLSSTQLGPPSQRHKTPETSEENLLPDWVHQKPAPEKQERKRVAPSKALSDTKTPTFYQEGTSINASRRGVLFHQMMEQLPNIPEARRLAFVEKVLKSHNLGEADTLDLHSMLTRCLTTPSLDFLFSGKGCYEVPITGVLEDTLINGQIDFLLERDGHIDIIDFKTNRVPPKHVCEVPQDYVVQLQTYKQLIRPLYPDHRITCHLLWAATGALMTVDPESAKDD